ncbi:MAG: hypothetical protein U0941_05190 [Planctomycetaceae bacterium]
MKSQTCRIQAEAVEALAEWKAFFAEQVALQAKELAKNTSSDGLITLDHYRQAATVAVQALATVLHDTGSSDDRQKAA